jgi:hypothetical protein
MAQIVLCGDIGKHVPQGLPRSLVLWTQDPLQTPPKAQCSLGLHNTARPQISDNHKMSTHGNGTGVGK